MVYFLTILLLATVLGELCNAADMCHPEESPVVCAIIEQRDNMADELAVAEGNRRLEVKKRAAEEEFWKEYVAGLPDGSALKSQVEKICAWKGQQNEPTSQLCKWWDDNYVAHPPGWKGPTK